MELLNQALVAPGLKARFAPVFWEPVSGGGECIVVILLIEPLLDSSSTLSTGAHIVIPRDRLSSMLGAARARSAQGVLREVAEFFTQRMRAGLSIEDLTPLFQGFRIGPARTARGYSADQLLDVAVRTVSVFGSADEIVDMEVVPPRHTHVTREFLDRLKRIVVQSNPKMQERFDRTVSAGDGTSVTIDYAHGRTLVQAVSLPISSRTASNAEREVKGKLFELQFVRSSMDGNVPRMVLLMNTSILDEEITDEQRQLAMIAMHRGESFAKYSNAEVVRVSSSDKARDFLLSFE